MVIARHVRFFAMHDHRFCRRSKSRAWWDQNAATKSHCRIRQRDKTGRTMHKNKKKTPLSVIYEGICKADSLGARAFLFPPPLVPVRFRGFALILPLLICAFGSLTFRTIGARKIANARRNKALGFHAQKFARIFIVSAGVARRDSLCRCFPTSTKNKSTEWERKRERVNGGDLSSYLYTTKVWDI